MPTQNTRRCPIKPIPQRQSRTQLIKQFLLITVAWFVPLSFFLFQVDFLFGADAYYHMHLAKIMGSEGLIVRTFPWCTESIWVDAWFDKEWLFHVLLIPFTSLGRTLGGQVAIIFLNGLVVLGLLYLMRGLGLSNRTFTFWAVLLPWCSWGIFWVRLILCRPHLLSLAILLFALGAMVRRKHLLFGFSMLLYALSYTGHWQLMGLALIYDTAYAVLDDDGKRRDKLSRQLPMIVSCGIGMLIGNLVHPQFPANVNGLFVQNVLVLVDAWTKTIGATDFRPQELRGLGRDILWICAPVLLGSVLIVVRKFRRGLIVERDAIVFGIYAVGYFVMALKSMRFLEYFIPAAVVFLAMVFARNPLPRIFPTRTLRLAGAFACLLIVLPLGIHGYAHYFDRYAVMQKLTQGGTDRYAGAAAWIRENAEDNEIVFSTAWPANSYLWAQAPKQRYLTFLDPTFMRKRDAKRYQLYLDIINGRNSTPVKVITEVFGSRIVFIDPHNVGLRQQLNGMGIKPVHEGNLDVAVYVLK